MISKTFNLRFKFITGLVLFALALGSCIGVIMYFHVNSIMKSEISNRSRMLLAQSDAVQNYVKTELRPEMFATLPEGRFIIKAMSSSYISREVMARLNLRDGSVYHYRRVSRSPRNPDATPNALESRLITYFNQNRDQRFWEDNARVGGKEYRLVARPVTFGPSCMNCHGEPDDAPAELIQMYGDKNGFHYTPDEVGGVVVAGFPVAQITDPAKELTLQYLSLYLLGIFLFAGMISLFFDRLVMKNLHHLSQIFKNRFSGEAEQGIIQKLEQRDEIEGLIEGVDELAHCLSTARSELENHTENLEKMVEERTLALKQKAKKHLGDVHLFVDLLSGFGESIDTRQLISGLLESVGRRYGADQVVYHCTVVSENYYTWKKGGPIPPLTPEIKNLLWTDQVLTKDAQWYIPVKSLESHWGILSISWSWGHAYPDLDPEILLALGQQVAVLIENIHAFSDIRLQHDMLQSVFEGISDPLLLIDEDCHIIIANTGSAGFLKEERHHARETELKAFLSQGRTNGDTGNLMDQVLETGKAVNGEILTPENQFFSLDLYPLPLKDTAAQYTRKIVLYARNITLEKQMGERLQQAERLSAIGQLAAGIAHEINNPLGVIQCYTDLVRDAVEDKEVLEDINTISNHTRNAQKVVQDLLNLSRPKKVVSGTCDINQAVEQGLQIFKTQAASRNITLETELAPDLPPVQCDGVILEQILTNLWLNAVDALRESGDTISFTTRDTRAGEIRLDVKDNGPGIPREIQSRIFDPFFTTKDVGKGTGLGLSLVYGFVTEIGARIRLTSDTTTCFSIYFPIHAPAPPAPETEETSND